MELKKLVDNSRTKIIEAHNAFYAEHHDVAENCLVETHNFLHEYFKMPLEVPVLAETETPLWGLKDQERVAQGSMWTDGFENFKRTNPSAYMFFLKILTDFVQQFPEEFGYVTVEDLQAVLAEI